MRRSIQFLLFTAASLVIFLLLPLHARYRQRQPGGELNLHSMQLRNLHVTDLCLATEARYTPGKRQGDIVALSVKEYYSLAMIDARAAFFVTGSDVSGPMGSELIPFKTMKDAKSFKLDHRGKRILRFNEITRQIIKSLN